MRASWLLVLLLLPSSGCSPSGAQPEPTDQASCTLVESGAGPAGEVPIRFEVVAKGLEVPWGLAFLPDGTLLVTERPGRVRRVRDGVVDPQPVAEPVVSARGEGGLLGLAIDPEFATNRRMYLYVTYPGLNGTLNRVERWVMSADLRAAMLDRVLLDGIAGATFHDGGRLRFGPDGLLYVGTGDAGRPDLAQDPASPNGKLLRMTVDGEPPPDNPVPGSHVFLSGIRNTQGFDWLDRTTMVVTDHGPSGDLGRRGHDEVNVARAGGNLGWPTMFGCQSKAELLAPRLTWVQAVPPGGAAVYRAAGIPEWRDSVLVGSLGATHLQRVVLGPAPEYRLERHEVYLSGQLGRIREVVVGPDGYPYLTTSNCDGRAGCPGEKDRVVRVLPAGTH